jgi:hypothetical protein
MVSFFVKPPEPCRPHWAGKIKLGWLYPLCSKALIRLFQPARFSTNLGLVVSLTQWGFDQPSTTGRPTDVCLFQAA